MSESKHQIIGGVKVVKRYSKGRCYACAFTPETSDKKIAETMAAGDAKFYPYNETTGRFTLEMFTSRPRYFKK